MKYLEKISEARKALGLTQDELAERVGMARISIARYETGQQSLTIDNLQRIAEALGRPVSWFFGDGTVEAPSDPISSASEEVPMPRLLDLLGSQQALLNLQHTDFIEQTEKQRQSYEAQAERYCEMNHFMDQGRQDPFGATVKVGRVQRNLIGLILGPELLESLIAEISVGPPMALKGHEAGRKFVVEQLSVEKVVSVSEVCVGQGRRIGCHCSSWECIV